MITRPIALLIEDDPLFLNIVSISLEKRNYNVLTAMTFEEGLNLVEANFISFIMTDIFMPGMGGIEGIKTLKNKHQNIPVIAISGGWAELSPEDTIEAAKLIGADAGIRKPVSSIDFDAALEAIGKGDPFTDE